MKKKIIILCLSAIFILLAACGNSATPEDTLPAQVESEAPSISLDEYKSMVSDLNVKIMDESIFLSNVGQYEHSYWKTFSNLPTYGDLDYDAMVERAMEWLKEKSEASADTLKDSYGEICHSYSSISQANVDGNIPSEISQNINDLFAAYNGLYLLVTKPSGDIDNFADNFNEYSNSIVNCNSILSALLDK